VPGNLDRPRRVSAEALKQCRRGRLMEIGPAIAIEDLVAEANVVVLDPAGGAPRPGSPAPTTLVIGPEGGLSDEELRQLAAAPRARLAATVLRIETAAIAAAAVWSAAWEGNRP
jgi:16S rRNA (uracil1498-N3)-methyltransferase